MYMYIYICICIYIYICVRSHLAQAMDLSPRSLEALSSYTGTFEEQEILASYAGKPMAAQTSRGPSEELTNGEEPLDFGSFVKSSEETPPVPAQLGGESPPPPPPAKVVSFDLDHHGPEHAAEESDPVVEEAGGDRKDGEPADAAEENANLTFSLD